MPPSRRNPCRASLLLPLLVALGGFPIAAIAQGPGRVAPTAPAKGSSALPVAASKRAEPSGTRGIGSIGKGSLLRLFVQANPMLWPLGLCSIVTLGYTLERLVALRRERVIPRDFVNRFLDRLAGGKLDRDRATELCRANDSTVARVFAAVVSNWGQPAALIRQSLAYDGAGEVADLKRNIRVLNGTATLAPLLGLLGTVVGMIQSFDALGGRGGSARGEALAQGISLALVTTALGLGIAIVSVTAYYYLLNRVDLLARQLDEAARRVIDLVAVDPPRAAPGPERRSGYPPAGDYSRHESRSL